MSGAGFWPKEVSLPPNEALSLYSDVGAMQRAYARGRNLSMDCYESDPLLDTRWAELVDRHPKASAFHSTNWLAALKNTYGYRPVVISTSRSTEKLSNGIVCCRIKSWLTGWRLVSLPFADHCDPLVEHPDECYPLVFHLSRQVDQGRWGYFETRPLSWKPDRGTSLNESARYYFHSLDLRRSEMELFRGFDKDCIQRKIRRAEREGLRDEQGNSNELLREFYGLLLITRRRHGLPPQPLGWFRELAIAFGPGLQVRVAYKGEQPVASILTLSHKKSLVYKYGCSDTRFHRLGGMQLLMWNAIREARHNGCEELDMGRSDADNPGLIAFKKNWGASMKALSYWRYPCGIRARPMEWQRTFMRRLVSLAPDVALTAAANLLYRHAA
jgi:Acetyltransferase (GNAT) domain